MGEYCKVLIIDDEQIMRQGIKHIMDWEKEGFLIVGEAKDGKEGLKMVKECSPHIVLADIVMPVMDGMEFSMRLQKECPGVKLIILSSYDKFEYVKTALLNGASDYILKPMLNAQSLLKTLLDTAAKIPDVQFCREGKTSYEMQLTRYMGGYQARLDNRVFAGKLPHPVYRILGVGLKSMPKEKPAAVRRKIENTFREFAGFPMLSVVPKEDSLCLIINYRDEEDADCHGRILSFADKMKQYDNNFFVALSWAYTDFQETRMVFLDGVQKTLSLKFYFPGKSLVILEEQLQKQKREKFEFELYSRYLENLELDEAVLMFLSYIEGLAKMHEDEYKIKNLAKNLLFNYFVEMERIGGAGEETRDRCFREIDTSEDVEAFLAVIRKYVPKPGVSEGRQCDLTHIHMEKMKEYIETHYTEDLKLMDLARQFGFSYSYTSTCFKENTVEGFSGYLNKIRIGKAKSELLHTAKTISEVGSEVGYTDQSYFCRVFKKMTGVSPGRYRKKAGRET